MNGRPQFDVNNPIIRVRSKSTRLKRRIARIAKATERDPAVVIRDGLANECDREEARLGLPPLPGHPEFKEVR